MVREYLLNVPIIVKKEVDKCGGFLTVIGMKQTKCVSFFCARQLKKNWSERERATPGNVLLQFKSPMFSSAVSVGSVA